MTGRYFFAAWIIAHAAACLPWEDPLCKPCLQGGCLSSQQCIQGVCVSEKERCGLIEIPPPEMCGVHPKCGADFECFEGECRTPIDLVAQDNQSCVLWPSGRVTCWGRALETQAPTSTTVLAPRDVEELSGIVELSGKGSSACALDRAGVVRCWGGNRYGQLGNFGAGGMSYTDDPRPQKISLDQPVVSIYSANNAHCGYSAAGELYCWGGHFEPTCQFGDPEVIQTQAPTLVPSAVRFEYLEGGSTAWIGLAEQHIYGFGWNYEGVFGPLHPSGEERICAPSDLGQDDVRQIAVGFASTCVLSGDKVVRCFGGLIPAGFEFFLPGDGVRNISAGGNYFCARPGDGGAVWCWGEPDTGLQGTAENITQSFAPPLAVPGTEHSELLAIGAFGHACFVRPGDGTYCWGSRQLGRIGDADNTVRMPAEMLRGEFSNIFGGTKHFCALENSGAVVCWGDNSSAQLGHGERSFFEPPARVEGVNAVALALGQEHSCALDGSGAVRCWGSNRYGQLGGSSSSTLPRVVNNLAPARKIQARWNATCALTENNEVHCWGQGFGQAPVRIATEVLDFATGGDHHTCLQKQVGRLECTARYNGQNYSWTHEIDAIAELEAGSLHGCALRADGFVDCYGLNNDEARLGDGTIALRNGVRRVVDLEDAVAIDAHHAHTCAVVRSGEVKCWGQDLQLGRLGIGPTYSRPRPVPVTGISGAVDIATGKDSSCALLAGGAIWCWGFDNAGQVTGTSPVALRPVKVDFSRRRAN